MKLAPTQARAIMKALKFRNGLVTTVTRDRRTKDVLMVAQMNRQATLKTLTTGMMHYWSRSRRKLWLKGERSGHYQRVHGLWIDCDADSLLFDVEQVGGACHRGYRSCFYRKLKRGRLVRVLKREFNPERVYG